MHFKTILSRRSKPRSPREAALVKAIEQLRQQLGHIEVRHKLLNLLPSLVDTWK